MLRHPRRQPHGSHCTTSAPIAGPYWRRHSRSERGPRWPSLESLSAECIWEPTGDPDDPSQHHVSPPFLAASWAIADQSSLSPPWASKVRKRSRRKRHAQIFGGGERQPDVILA